MKLSRKEKEMKLQLEFLGISRILEPELLQLGIPSPNYLDWEFPTITSHSVDAFTQESVELSGRNTKFFCQESVEIINTMQLSTITLNAHAPYSFMLTNEFVPFQAADRITEE